MKLNKSCIIWSIFFTVNFIIWITLITLSSINTYNKQSIKYVSCYNPNKITDYGKIYDTCNTKQLNGTKFLQIINGVDLCSCNTMKCIKYTKISVVGNDINFDMCYDNIDWAFLIDNCAKCVDNELYLVAISILFPIMSLTLCVCINFFGEILKMYSRSEK